MWTAALTQRLQLSVADARSDLQRHSSTLRFTGPSSTNSNARFQHDPNCASPDRTALASPRFYATPVKGAPTAGGIASASSPRIASVRQRPSPLTSNSSSPRHTAGGLWSSPKQDDAKRFTSAAKRLPQSPTLVHSMYPLPDNPSQKHISNTVDADQPRWQ